MPDDADRTQEISEVYENAMLRRHKRAPWTPPTGKARLKCEDCGKTIPRSRLKVNPQATRCIRCQTLLEHGGNT